MIYDHLTIGLDEEAIQSLNYRLEDIGKKLINPPSPHEPQPPEWWIPEEQNWQNIQAFLGAASTIDGAISQGKEVTTDA